MASIIRPRIGGCFKASQVPDREAGCPIYVLYGERVIAGNNAKTLAQK